MKKKTVSFFDPSFKNENLPFFFRQTEGFKGIYDNINFFMNNLDADWQIIGTWVNNITKIKGKKIVYLQQEPPESKLPSKFILDNSTFAITPFKFDHFIKQFITFTPLQWTYDLNISFENGKGHCIELINKNSLEHFKHQPIPEKNKMCSMIVSTKSFLPGHLKRFNFTKKLIDHFKNKIDFFGFGFNPIKNKKDAIDPYIYSIGIENSSYPNYWTEKIADIYLGYTAPIYYGCTNIRNYFSEDSFIKLNINNFDFSVHEIEKILNNPYSIDFEAIKEDRKKVIEKYNFFKIISDCIKKYEVSENVMAY
ncbi:MAG: hypothetical protein CMJ41_05295 [Phycisphaerae bacterium]|nr:hypothetical protein [Phycisphaerae bacterium]